MSYIVLYYMANMAQKSGSERYTMRKQAKCCILTQNHIIDCELAIIIVLLSWQFSLHDGTVRKEAIGETIATGHSPFFEFKWSARMHLW